MISIARGINPLHFETKILLSHSGQKSYSQFCIVLKLLEFKCRLSREVVPHLQAYQKLYSVPHLQEYQKLYSVQHLQAYQKLYSVPHLQAYQKMYYVPHLQEYQNLYSVSHLQAYHKLYSVPHLQEYQKLYSVPHLKVYQKLFSVPHLLAYQNRFFSLRSIHMKPLLLILWFSSKNVICRCCFGSCGPEFLLFLNKAVYLILTYSYSWTSLQSVY